MFSIIPAVLSGEHLVAARAKLESSDAPWVDGRVSAGHQGAAVKNNQQIAAGSDVARELGDLILGQLERNAFFISTVLPHRVYPPIFNRYAQGMQFGTHVDGAVRQIPGTALKMRTDLSATLLLVPTDTYGGGELLIDDGYGAKTAKFAAGDLVVYTATSRHQVTRVTRGVRLACIFWIQSLIRDDGRRLQLFELDQTIQQLTRSAADADCLVRLTGHYHTLLRLWTEI